MLRSVRAAMTRIARGLLWTALGAGTFAAAAYALALLALHDLEAPQPPPRALALGDAEIADDSVLSAAGTESGALSLSDGGKRIAAVGGHKAPVAQAAFVADGAEILTVDTRGTVRATDVDRLRLAEPFDVAQLVGTVRTRLWEPYVKPVAETALAAVAQVLPLHIPDAVKGRRGRAFRDCKDGFCGPQMIELEPGRFLMGSTWTEQGRLGNEERRRLVTIGQGFAIGRFELTFDEWDACVADGGCKHVPNDNGWGRGSRPAIYLAWDDIKNEYLPWLNRKLGLSEATAYRLPTEAEWEFAARAGTVTRWSFGDDERQLGEHAWYEHNSSGRTQPVATRSANTFGLHDMHGNVLEGVEDCAIESIAGASAATTAVPATTGCVRVVRGGSWRDQTRFLRSAMFIRYTAANRLNNLGFRLARTLPASR